MQEQTDQLLLSIEKQLNKDFGAGSSMLLSNKDALKLDLYSTGILSLDSVLGGGIPRGRMVELFGMPSTGKTTLALQIAKVILDSGGCVYVVDMEQALNADYIKILGLDPNKLLISQPDNGNEALEMAEVAIKGGVQLVIIDSVDALVPKQEVDGDFGDSNMGSRAKLLAQACRKFQPAARESGTLILWINQLRDKFGGYAGTHITTGGNALRFYTSQRIELSNIGQIKSGEAVIGNRTAVKIVKNKIFPPHKRTELDLIYGEGFSALSDLVDLATNADIIKKAGSWYSYNNEKLGQGKENVKEFLLENEEIRLKIVETLKGQMV